MDIFDILFLAIMLFLIIMLLIAIAAKIETKRQEALMYNTIDVD